MNSSQIGNAFQTALQHHQAGQLAQAEVIYHHILKEQPNHTEALHLLGAIAYQTGKIPQAIELYRKALNINPDYAEVYNNLGVALRDLGRFDEAIFNYRKAVGIRANFAEAHFNAGIVLKDQGKLDEAVDSYRQAIFCNPHNIAAYINLGVALKTQGKLHEALVCYREALTYKADSSEAYYNLGNTFKELGRLNEALICFQNALTYQPDSVEGFNNLGSVFYDLGKLDEAIICYQQALTLKPDYAEAHNNLAAVRQCEGALEAACTGYRRALTLKPDDCGAHSNLLFCLNYHPDQPAAEIYAEYRCWNKQHARALYPAVLKHGNAPDPLRRLRIAYLSPDLCKHSIRHFIEPVLAHHDKNQFEVFAYAQVAVEDEISTQLKKHTDHWLNTRGMSDELIAATIRADRIDILIDLAGHTAKNRLLVFARKPAPIQVTWMGYGYTTGMDVMDYFLSDCDFTPSGCEALFSEKLVRLPIAGVYRPEPGMGEPGPLPALQNSVVTLGSLSRCIRINYRVVRCWAAILQRLPNARLMINSFNFQTETIRDSLQHQFARHGIAANRLLLGYESPPWDILRQIDISLDCFPHNSGTTLWESLYMGIPFVTLAGRPSVGRSGAAALEKIQRREWIAYSEHQYIDKAVQLASDIERLAVLRGEMRSQMQASLLMDEPAFVGSLESAYRRMWQRWCNGLPADNIDV